MPRYEFKDEKSSKFWDIQIDGSEVTTNWGRIGTNGQTKTKSFPDGAAAQKEYEKQIKSKTKKGYELAEAPSSNEAPSSKAASGGNADLEAAIRANPDDVSVYQVYGDWLQAQGDPLGELVSVQCAMAGGATDALKAEEKKLLKANAEAFLGAPHKKGDSLQKSGKQWRAERLELEWKYGYALCRFRHGFIDRLFFGTGYYDEDEDGRGETEAAAILSTLLAAPAARFVREIYLGELWSLHYEDGEGPQMEHAAKAVANAPCAPTVKKVIFQGGDHDLSGVSLDVTGLAGACPNLEELTAYAGELTLEKIDSDKLKALRVQTGGLASADLKKVVASKIPNIEDLEVWFGADEYGADCSITDVAPLLAKDMPKLKRLGLMNSEFGDDICKAVVTSPLLKQLDQLDLSMGVITDEGANALIAAKDDLAHLEKLSVRGYFSDAVANQLQTLAKDRSIEVEGDEEEDYRYVEVGE